jgi:hypothetical protein
VAVEPPVRVPPVQEKLPILLSASVMPLPAAPETVTVAVPPELAETPTVPPRVVIALAMLLASVEAVDEVSKYVPLFEEFKPPRSVVLDQEKLVRV